MLLRLFLCVLIAALGCPAAATQCHDAPGMHMAMADAPAPHHHEAAAPHGCLGCIPPETLRVSTLFVPMAVAAAPIARALPALDAGVGIAPALPPPRG